VCRRQRWRRRKELLQEEEQEEEQQQQQKGAEMGKSLCRCRRARLRAALCDSNEASFILFYTCARASNSLALRAETKAQATLAAALSCSQE